MRSGFSRIGFPLERRIERVGNLVIAGAQDEITCNLAYLGNETLRFQVGADEFLPGGVPRDGVGDAQRR